MPRKTIRQYYLLSFLSSAVGIQIVSAVYATFLVKNGLNLFEVNLVNAIYFTTLFVCEIPTGAFADIFGRKFSYVVSAAVMSTAMIVYGTSHTFFGFVCAEMIAALGMTFRTGAFQAWLVDSLKHQGFGGPFHRIFGRSTFYSQAGGSIGAITGAYLGAYHTPLPWLVGGVGMAGISLLAFCIMQEEYFVRKSFSWRKGLEAMKNTVISSIRYGSEDKAVRFILVVTFIQIYAVQALNMFWQQFFRNEGVKDEHLGFIYSGMMIFLAAGALVATRIKAHGIEKQVLLWSMTYVGMVVLLTTLSPVFSLTLILFLTHEVGRGFWAPMVESYLHSKIPSHERATITSFCAIAPHIGGAIGLVISGAIAELFGITTAWGVASGVLVLGAFVVGRSGNRGHTQSGLH